METVLAIPTIAQLCRFLYVPLGTSPCLPEKGERRWKGDILAVTETTLKSSNKKIGQGQGSRNPPKKKRIQTTAHYILPSKKLIYPLPCGTFEVDDFPFPNTGYVSFPR